MPEIATPQTRTVKPRGPGRKFTSETAAEAGRASRAALPPERRSWQGHIDALVTDWPRLSADQRETVRALFDTHTDTTSAAQ